RRPPLAVALQLGLYLLEGLAVDQGGVRTRDDDHVRLDTTAVALVLALDDLATLDGLELAGGGLVPVQIAQVVAVLEHLAEDVGAPAILVLAVGLAAGVADAAAVQFLDQPAQRYVLLG